MQAVASVLPAFDGLARQRAVTPVASPSSSSRVCAPSHLVVEAKKMTVRELRERRHLRLRKKVNGTEERPRLAVFRSNNHIYAQVIDDTKGHTLVAASTLTPTIKSALTEGSGANKDAATLVGKQIAEACLSKNINKVCFDRGGYQYHGRVQALAEAAREAGLQF